MAKEFKILVFLVLREFEKISLGYTYNNRKIYNI